MISATIRRASNSTGPVYATGVHRLVRQIGLKPAMGPLLTGREVAAADAPALGIINSALEHIEQFGGRAAGVRAEAQTRLASQVRNALDLIRVADSSSHLLIFAMEQWGGTIPQ